MEPTPPPVLLLSTDAVSEGRAGDEHDDLALPTGWRAHRGFDLPPDPWDLTASRLVCVGTVDDDTAARGALTAVARGAGLAVQITIRGGAHHRFLEDLHKISEPRPYAPSAAATTGLSELQQALLDDLADGSTVTAAAAARHVSRRTANRLLADARSRLGAETTAAAVGRWIERRTGPSA